MKPIDAAHDSLNSQKPVPAPMPRALVALSLATLLSSLGTSIANVALPTFADVFGVSVQTVQWIVLAYLLAITTLIVGVGRLGDLIGRRRLLLVGVAIFTAASALCSAAPTLGWLIAARGLQGLGAAAMMALALAFVGETVTKAKVGSAMGLLGTMSAVGTALGPSLGGVLIAGFGWPAIFLINVPLGILALVAAYRYLPIDRRTPNAMRPRFDIAGTALLAVTLAAYALAMTIGRGHFELLNFALIAAAVVGFVIFLRVQLRSSAPLIRLGMLRNPILRGGFILSALVSTVLMATLIVGPFYLTHALGLDAARVGLVIAVGPIVVAFSGIPAGRLVDRFGAPRITLIGLIAVATGSALLMLLPTNWAIAGYVGCIVVVTAGYALFQTANNAAVMTDVVADQRGVVSGLLNLSRNLGLITGASAMSAAFALAVGPIDIAAAGHEAVAAGLHGTFSVATLLMLVAAVVALTHRAGPTRT